jgi:uncharacterized protein YndB with AHSA1/START domain
MPVVSTTQDPEALTLVLVADFPAAPDRVWQVWTDPRQLERWWGPPTWPATFERHEVRVGGESRYFMTGPEGEKSRGWWRFTAVDAPRSLAFDDGFADESGEPNPDMPTIGIRAELAAEGSGTRMTVTSSFATSDQMQQLVQMGMAEGMTEAAAQLDALLAEG